MKAGMITGIRTRMHSWELSSVSKVFDRLYVGNLSAARDLSEHNPCGIKRVLNCTPKEVSLPHSFIVRQLGLLDGKPIPHDRLNYALNWIFDSVVDGPVLICCEAGISRSPGICAAYLRRIGMSWDEAVTTVTTSRPIAMIHPEISRSIRAFFADLYIPIGGCEARQVTEEGA